MTTTSLRDGHDVRRLRRLQEKLSRVDERFLQESRQTQLFLEAIDEKDLQQAQAVVAKLQKLRELNIAGLNDVIDRIKGDLSRYVGEDGLIGAIKGKLRNLVGMKNPLVKAMTFAAMLETGFNQFGRIIPTIIDNAEKLQDDVTIASALTNDPKGREKMKALKAAFAKALRPQGFFAQFTGKIPEFSGAQQEMLIQDLITGVKIGTLRQASNIINSGPSATNLGDDIKDSSMGAGQGGGVGAGEPQPSDKAAGTEQTSTTNPTAPGTRTQPSSQGGGTVKQPSKEWLNDFSGFVQKQTGLDAATVNKVLAVLVKNGKLREGKTLGSDAAAELLRLLAGSGNLTEAIGSGIIRLQISDQDLQDLLGA